MFPADILALAQKVITAYAAENRKIVTAESCTAGLIAAALTSIPGSSAVLERGFVTYSNESKMEMLGVTPLALNKCGAVSPQVADQMTEGALKNARADTALSTTGYAGPDGGETNKPIGLIYFSLAKRDGITMHFKCQYTGDRDSIRMQAVTEGLKLLLTLTGSDED